MRAQAMAAAQHAPVHSTADARSPTPLNAEIKSDHFEAAMKSNHENSMRMTLLSSMLKIQQDAVETAAKIATQGAEAAKRIWG